jgi:hypothetical protein
MSEYSPVIHVLFDTAPFVLASLTDAGGLLTMRLEGGGGRKINICFDGQVYYSKMDEGDALRTLVALKQESCLGFPLVEARRSDLLDWFIEESFGIHTVESLRHYIVLTEDDLVNVVALDAPQIASA